MFKARTVKELMLEGRLSYWQAVSLFERFLISEALKQFRGNQTKTADFLGMHVNSVRNKLRGKYQTNKTEDMKNEI